MVQRDGRRLERVPRKGYGNDQRKNWVLYRVRACMRAPYRGCAARPWACAMRFEAGALGVRVGWVVLRWGVDQEGCFEDYRVLKAQGYGQVLSMHIHGHT